MSVSVESLRQTLSGLLSYPPREAAPEDAIAGLQPKVVVEPANEEEVSGVLGFADRHDLKVLVRGGGTQLGLGLPPDSGDILLCTTRLADILEHEPHDQTISVHAGVRLADLEAHLAKTQQWLALDPPLSSAATLGGIISTNASGARRLRFGAVRDQILGIRVVLPDGTIARGGGKVVKNVAGYDLPKLYCGALGTLGVIVAANFRLYPLPAYSRTLLLTATSAALLGDLVLKLTASTLAPTAIDLLGPRYRDRAPTLAVRFESNVPAAIADQLDALALFSGELAGSAQEMDGDTEKEFWQAADGWISTLPTEIGEGSGSLLLKASLLPSGVSVWLSQLESLASAASLVTRWRAHIGHGIVRARIYGEVQALVDSVEVLRAAAHSTRGSLVVEDAQGDMGRRLDVWGPIDALELMRRVKWNFDPHSTLNPGRFVGGI